MSQSPLLTIHPAPGEKRPWKERLAACSGCDRCGDRCVSGFPVSYREYRRIRDYLDSQDPPERDRVATQEKDLPWPGAPEITYEACRFRDVERGRCSIYPVRPLVCRLFGHVEWLPCPAGIITEVAPDGIPLMEWYARRDLHTYEEWLAIERDSMGAGRGGMNREPDETSMQRHGMSAEQDRIGREREGIGADVPRD